MPSVTTWLRVEPQCRNADMRAGLQARLWDPLWLLARQWQVGEFEGEDTGSPAVARWRGDVAALSRYHPGPLEGGATAPGERMSPSSTPLEAAVERERVQFEAAGRDRLRLAAVAGQHFLRLLAGQATSRSYRDVFREHFAFVPPSDDERRALDGDTLAFLDVVAGRTPDGRRLYDAMDRALRREQGGRLPGALGIEPGDVAEVEAAARMWLAWVDTMISQAGGESPAWLPERLEYGFSVAARTAIGETVLTAREYYDGRLDWQDFAVNSGATLGAADAVSSAAVVRSTIPAPVSYAGMPASRFWQFEDAQVDFGAVDAGAEDLARLLLVEFALTYGNDWFVIPIDLPVGSLCRTQSLVVTSTFGERFLVPAAHEAGPRAAAWRMFRPSVIGAATGAAADAGANLLVLPPALVSTLESRPIEDVLVMRDEMANLAWAIERTVESPVEQPLRRIEQQPAPEPPRPDGAASALRYRLASAVPDHWIPLLPVRRDDGLRLRRGRTLELDGQPRLTGAVGRILGHDAPLALFDEEVPREGLRVTRTWQLARWHDGSTHLWIGRRKTVGRGEGSSGLRFDRLEP